MEAIILVGLQGTGKTTFYRERFFETHIRLSLDMLRTRFREQILFDACLAAKQPVVIDNTNALIAERASYIQRAKAARFRVVAYVFRSALRDALGRNAHRQDKAPIPARGVIATYKKLKVPQAEEGFDAVYSVELMPEHGFVVKPWQPPQPEPAA